MSAFKTWDIETTTDSSFKRKANPFDPRNWVVTHGVKGKTDSQVSEYRFGHSRPPSGWMLPVLEGTKVLAGFNIKFDLQHALQDPVNLKAYMKWVAAGNYVWDCQLAEYLLEGMTQENQMLSLDEVAPRYGGDVKVDEVKALWEAGVRTEDIDPELLTRYLCGGEDENGVWKPGDVHNTEKIALAQITRAHQVGQLNSIILNMGALMFTVEAERNGMFVDVHRGYVIADELKVVIDKLDVILQSYMPKDFPKAFEFNWNSSAQKSAIIFGGTVQYDAHEYDTADGKTIWRHVYDEMTPEERPKLLYAQKDEEHYLLIDGTTMSCEKWDRLEVESFDDPSVVLVPRVVNKGGKNAGEPKTKKVKVDNLDKPKGRGTKCPYTFARVTEPKPKWKNDSGWSTSSDIIEELGTRNIPFLKDMAQLQKLTKDLGTYYITISEKGERKGMLSLADPLLWIIHHKLNMVSTVTARLSSSDPNLQNIPKGNKSQVKTLFVSRFGRFITDDFGTSQWIPSGKIIQSDFSSLEIYIQAILTKCAQLIADLKAGLDMHVLRLSNSPAGGGHTYEELLKLCKGWTREDGVKVDPVAEWDYKRTDSKVYSFQAAYGAGDAKIAETTGMDPERVAQLRAADDARYPEINKYFEGRAQEIKLNRKPWRSGVPHPDHPAILMNLGRSYVRTPDGKLYSYTETAAPDFLVKKGVYQSFMPTEIKNYEVQGEGGEWAKAAMWLALRAFYARENFGGLALLVNQVHDACYADAHESVSFEAAALLHAAMEGASDFMEYYFKWEIPVPVPSDTSWGKSMMDEEKIPGLKERAAVYRQEMRDQYMKGYVPSFARNIH